MPTEELKAVPELEAVMIEHPMPFDLIIIGGGPAGLTAGLYAARAGLSTLLIEKAMFGGTASVANEIENFPGFPDGIKGIELARKMEEQAKKFGLQTIFGAVTEIRKEKGSKLKEVMLENNPLKTKAVIIAAGADPKKLNIPGEKELRGRGVSYCATCDGPFYKDKKVIVIGGGNSAVEEALFLTRYTSLVTIVHRRNKLRADAVLAKRAAENKKIYIAWESVVEEILGKGKVEGVAVKNVKTGHISKLDAQGVFIYVGYTPHTDFIKDMVKLDAEGFITTDEEMRTSAEGIFAAGDIRSKKFRQVITAAAEGALAADSAKTYIDETFK